MNELACPACGKSVNVESRYHTCPECGEPLLFLPDLDSIAEASVKSLVPKGFKRVSLGEGRTPLIEHRNFLLKLEFLNPTGSFKDRGAAMTVSRALMAGWTTIVEDSSGNAGIAIAAYAARAGIRAKIYAPADAPQGKLRLIRAFGASLITARSRNEAHEEALRDAEGVYVGHVVEPMFIEGVKDLALELVLSGMKFDVVVVPVASGTLFLGLYKGFDELVRLGLVDSMPTLIPVEACGYSKLSPYIKTVHLGCGEDSKSVLADALRLTIVPRLRQIVKRASRVSPYAIVVGDEIIGEALKELYLTGLAVEPTSAAVYAAAKYVAKDLGGRVIVPLTGSGLKYVPIPSDVLDRHLFA